MHELQNNKEGKLFVVATPIGNLEDISLRAIKVLKEVDVIAAEDTRHSRKLLLKFGISSPMVPYHQHNESRSKGQLLKRLANGESIALICDSGTPLISDPGRSIVRSAHEQKFRVIPIPGSSALTCALSVCGLSVDKIQFEGFLPAKKVDRLTRLKQLSAERRCFVFFEAPHRILVSLSDIADAFGDDCQACIAREMTKIHETIRVDELGNLMCWVKEDQNQQKGEFVILVDNTDIPTANQEEQIDNTLEILLEECSPRKAAELASRILGVRRNRLYKRAMQIKEDSQENKSTD